MSRPVFLSSKWVHLVFANFEIDPHFLQPHIPAGTELDFFNGKTYVSLVAFLFEDTKILGVVPAFFHQDFEEINLRFYVLRSENGHTKRGVVFIKEIVPKPFLAWVARTFYHENYIAMPTLHIMTRPPVTASPLDERRGADEERPKAYFSYVGGKRRGRQQSLSPRGEPLPLHNINVGVQHKYQWGPFSMEVRSEGKLLEAKEASFERWITEHYWGYTRVAPKKTLEYEVKHPIWDLYEVTGHCLKVDFPKLYGQEFQLDMEQGPSSVFLARGSEVTVHWPSQINFEST